MLDSGALSDNHQISQPVQDLRRRDSTQASRGYADSESVWENVRPPTDRERAGVTACGVEDSGIEDVILHEFISCYLRFNYLSGNANDTAGGTATAESGQRQNMRAHDVRVTGLQRVGVTALAEVILAGVNDDGTAEDRVGAEQGNVLVCDAVSFL